MAQSVKHPIPDFGSGHNLRVVRSSPASGSTLSMEPAWDFLSPSLTPSSPDISLKKKKKKKLEKQTKIFSPKVGNICEGRREGQKEEEQEEGRKLMEQNV